MGQGYCCAYNYYDSSSNDDYHYDHNHHEHDYHDASRMWYWL
jgi:hypothetical protein